MSTFSKPISQTDAVVIRVLSKFGVSTVTLNQYLGIPARYGKPLQFVKEVDPYLPEDFQHEDVNLLISTHWDRLEKSIEATILTPYKNQQQADRILAHRQARAGLTKVRNALDALEAIADQRLNDGGELIEIRAAHYLLHFIRSFTQSF